MCMKQLLKISSVNKVAALWFWLVNGKDTSESYEFAYKIRMEMRSVFVRTGYVLLRYRVLMRGISNYQDDKSEYSCAMRETYRQYRSPAVRPLESASLAIPIPSPELLGCEYS
ncbi:hypothetical protein CBL_13730 [Carabus blaptoides fortunei]